MCDEDKTSNSVQACSDLAHVVLVLVGVRRVTVVHTGYEGVLVVIHFCVAIFVRDFLYQEMFSLHRTLRGHAVNLGKQVCRSATVSSLCTIKQGEKERKTDGRTDIHNVCKCT